MAERRYTASIDGEAHAVVVTPNGDGAFTVRIGDGAPELAQVLAEGPTLTLLLGARVLELAPARDGRFGGRGGVNAGAEPARAGARTHATGASSGKVQAPMPGRIVKLLSAAGEQVAAGAGLVVMEAMKMENEISAPRAGTIARVLVRVGDTVERDAVLVELEAP